ncbi:MAG: HhH-GPD-type base excision DNA repair protein [Gaiellaceae bacterium]
MADDRLYFTPDDEANALLASDPVALLIGFALDQQVTVPKAFSGPLELKRRLGTLDPGRIATTDPAELERVFREKPAIHRFPGAMATRTRDLCATIVEEYDGRAERVWTEAADGADLKRRLGALPGFGDMKVRSMLAVLAKRLGVRPPGIDAVLPGHPTLGDVDSPEALESYQAAKRAYKAAQRAASA